MIQGNRLIIVYKCVMTRPRSRDIVCAVWFYAVSIVNYIALFVAYMMNEELWTVRKEVAVAYYVL